MAHSLAQGAESIIEQESSVPVHAIRETNMPSIKIHNWYTLQKKDEKQDSRRGLIIFAEYRALMNRIMKNRKDLARIFALPM